MHPAAFAVHPAAFAVHPAAFAVHLPPRHAPCRLHSRQAALPALQISPSFVITEAEITRIAEVFGAAFDAVAVRR